MDRYFLFRPKPFDCETLSSYIQRVSIRNLISPDDIWRTFTKKKYTNNQNCISIKLDVNPNSVFDLSSFENSLMLENGTLKKMSLFSLIDAKINFNLESTSNTYSFVRNFFVTHRRYCPMCLNERQAYKLIWQIKGIDFCMIHKVPLVSSCPKCNKKILLLAKNGQVGVCSFCDHKLQTIEDYNYVINKQENILYETWDYLMTENTPKLKKISGLSYKETLCIKIIYFMRKLSYNSIENHFGYIIEGNDNEYIIPFELVIDLLMKTQHTISEFINEDIPIKFIKYISSKDITKYNNLVKLKNSLLLI